MNILFCNKFFYPKGGAEVSMFSTETVMRRHGHKVLHFGMKDARNIETEYEKYFVSNVDYRAKGLARKLAAVGRLMYSLEAKRCMDKLLREHSVDVAHLNNIAHQISPSIIDSLSDAHVPIVMTIRDYKLVCPSYGLVSRGRVCEKCSNKKFINAVREKCHKDSLVQSALVAGEMILHHRLMRIYEKVDTFIATSEFVKRKFYEMGFAGRIVVIPNFVLLSNYPQPDYTYRGRKIAYAGRLSSEKGVCTLIRAMSALDVELVIIGDGPERINCERLVEEMRLKNVKFIGHVSGSELNLVVGECAAVVVPSEWHEPFGRAVIEAYALGKPVISARIGGMTELIEEGVTGYTYPAGDVESLRDTIVKLVTDPARCISMSKEARRKAETEFNEEKHYESLVEVYRSAIAKGKEMELRPRQHRWVR